MKALYIVGFSKGQQHFSYLARLTGEEYVAATQLLKRMADAFEIVKYDNYRWEETAENLMAAINELLS